MTLFQSSTGTSTGYELFKRLKSTRQANIFPCHFLEPSKDCKFVPWFSAIFPFNTTAFVMKRAKLLDSNGQYAAEGQCGTTNVPWKAFWNIKCNTLGTRGMGGTTHATSFDQSW